MNRCIECYSQEFWWLGNRVKCPKCMREYYVIGNELFCMIPADESEKIIYNSSEWDRLMKIIDAKRERKKIDATQEKDLFND